MSNEVMSIDIIKQVMLDDKLSLESKGLMIYLALMSDDKKELEFGKGHLSEELKLSRLTVAKYVEELEDRGYIKTETGRKQGRFKATKYTILI